MNLTPAQALELLNQLRQKIEMNGKDHDLARCAYDTLAKFVAEHPVAPKPTP